jgi:predicted nuclease of predicted toxin-antitoxin system
MSSKRRTRHKLLLDEGVHLPQSYPKLNNLHDLVHVSQVNLKGEADEKIFNYSKQSSRITIVFNIKDFRKLIGPGFPSIIASSTNLTDKQVDLKICKALRELKPSETKGYLISVTNSGIHKKRLFLKSSLLQS